VENAISFRARVDKAYWKGPDAPQPKASGCRDWETRYGKQLLADVELRQKWAEEAGIGLSNFPEESPD